MSAESSTPVRRSSRLQTKPAVTYTDDDHEPSSEGISPGETSSASRRARKPPAKRPRRSLDANQTDGSPKQLAPKGRRRDLSRLVDMPLDILFEIFGHLHPYDLLQLSRTTKALRSVLMRPSAVTIWRNARQNVDDLPDCPDDLTEPAYANLLFDQHCHFCVKARVMNVLWTLRCRACKACLKEHFTTLFDVLVAVRQRIPIAAQNPMISTSTMVPMEYVNNKLLIPKTVAEELCASVEACKGDPEALKKLDQERSHAVTVLKANADIMVDWQARQAQQRTMDLIDLRCRRRKQIIDRLCELGYGEDLKWMTFERVEQFLEHPLVKQPKELTDRIWNNIKDAMVAFAQESRVERLMRERCAHYVNRLSLLSDLAVRWLVRRPLWELLPTIADLSHYTSAFRHLMNFPRGVFFEAIDTTPARVDKAMNDAVSEWRALMMEKLYEMIIAATTPAPSSSDAPTATSSGGVTAQISDVAGASTAPAPAALKPEPTADEITTLSLSACTWFRCTNPRCNALLDALRTLAHGCAHAPPLLRMHPASDADDLHNAYVLVCDEHPWNLAGDKVVFDVDARDAAVKVVRACGGDPARMLTDDRALQKARLVCSLCSSDGQVCVMAWKHAVAHLTAHAKEGRDAKVTRLSKRDRRIVRALEPPRLVGHETCTYKMYGCLRCRVGPPTTLVQVLNHCKDEHYVEWPDEEVDYALHPDADTEPGAPAHDMYYDASLFLTPIRR
ncbi:hypothetical protein GY45DRAFT_1432269 [Cubamyces sp. BRFM 1775]|nr:hypothetical protein GY45DRAFT_1432269 [Cubamyces sp. BRFM 1775]